MASHAAPAAAQSASGAGGLRRFEIARSPIQISGDVRPRQYLGVQGRRAAWLGWETGEAELWIHPLKVVQDFQLAFRVPQYVDPIRGADIARTVHVRPELATIVYAHQAFTMKQHVLAPLDEGALLVLLDVDATVPFDIVVSFRPVLQYAWPAGLGGQYASWDGTRRAFLLSESRRQHNVLIGSPWAAAASTQPAHALPDAPSVFTIHVDAARARREFVPIVIAGGIEPRDAVAARYLSAVDRAETIYRERVSRADALRTAATTLSTPDATLDRAFEWAKVNLDEQLVCNPDLGCGLVAGWGPSGKGTRPGFGWFFGGDAAINSLAMSSVGMSDEVAQGLRFLAKYQREDGKITHEISQAAARIPWFTDFPYAYYHADTTPFWIVALWRHVRAAGDRALLQETWPRVQKAFAWCKAHDSDGDGLIENTTAGLGAIEVGEIGRDIHQDIYLAAVWVEALSALAQLAPLAGDETTAREAAEWRARASASLDGKYWLPDAGHHAFGILRSGATNDALTVWPATAAAFGLLSADRARSTLARIASPALTSDWGARMLSADHRLYDPAHYNMGAVWPFVTGFVAWGHYAYDRPWSGFPLVSALARLTFDWARGRHPELLSGDLYRPLDEAVPQQFFASSMLVTPLLRGLIGWDADAPSRAARLAPALPPAWPRVRVERLRVGESMVEATLEQTASSLAVTLRASGPAVEVEVAPWLPVGATRVRVDGREVVAAGAVAAVPRGAIVEASATAGRRSVRVPAGSTPRTVRFSWEGGLSVSVPETPLEPGQRSHRLRVTDLTWDAASGVWSLAVAGPAGRRAELMLHGTEVRVTDGPATVEGQDGPVTRVAITLPEGPAAFGRATVRLAQARATGSRTSRD
jgi:glycogen debranching enzyme